MPTLDRQDDVFFLDLGEDENRLHPDWIAAVNAALETVESADGPHALVTTATGSSTPPAMSALIQDRLTPQVAHEAMLTRRRYGGTDAEAAAIVDRAVGEDQVRTTALELAQAQSGKAGDTLATIKARMYASTLTLLRDPADPLG